MFYFNLAQLIFVIFIYVLVALHVLLLIWVNLAQLILSSFFSRQFGCGTSKNIKVPIQIEAMPYFDQNTLNNHL